MKKSRRNNIYSNQKSKKTNLSNSIKSKESKESKISDNKIRKWFYLVLVFIPIVFVLLLESSLQIFNYGYNLSQWTEVGNDKLMLNNNISRRYFNNISFTPKASDDTFDKQKKSNAFRVFVLGGSSADGFPYTPMGSFSRYIKKRLELVYPNSTIEVVNLGMSAVNSYTMLDLIPGVIEKKPNLILIYAGHNEYYGALGVASNESFGSSRFIKKTILYLNNFKTTQLIRNIISSVISLVSKDNSDQESGTLMSKIAQDQTIKLNSETFDKGIEQFSDNLSEILDVLKKRNIHVIVGRLVSNYKDQKPFVSEITPGFNTADEVYLDAMDEIKNENFLKAESLFVLAKDLDALRFRAPEKINKVINDIADRYDVPTVPIDSIFNANSPYGVTGDNLMVDHLHPNVEGYMLIGNGFYEKMKKYNYLPGNEKPHIAFNEQDSLTRENFVFTTLDSVIGNNIITLLKNDWPFTKDRSIKSNISILKANNFLDSIAIKYTDKKITYVDAYLEAASIALRRDNIKGYLKYMNLLIYKYPGLKNIQTATKYFYEQKKINPQDYTSKRLGIIYLYNKDYENAINHLTESYKSNAKDAEVLYHLSLTHFEKQNYKLALDYINKSLIINPNNSKYILLKNKIKN